jgi:hypothetical protein
MGLRFYLFGPRFLGIRPGVSFNPNDLRIHKSPTSTAANYIYVIKGYRDQCRQHVKIGVTKDPERRLAEIQTGQSRKIDYAFIAPTSGDPRAVEKEAHAMLARSRLNGEWFDVPPELAIAAVTGAAAKLGQSLTAKPAINDTPYPRWKVFAFLMFLVAVAGIIWLWINFVLLMLSNPIQPS